MNGRKVADCRKFPSDTHCTLTIAGTEAEVMLLAVHHAVHDHGHTDTPQLRSQLRDMLADE